MELGLFQAHGIASQAGTGWLEVDRHRIVDQGLDAAAAQVSGKPVAFVTPNDE
jgi:hypothetical protein